MLTLSTTQGDQVSKFMKNNTDIELNLGYENNMRSEELIIANKTLGLQNAEKDKRADMLLLANFEKDKRANELIIANMEKDKRADELVLANIEKDKRADELVLANKEKDRRANELVIANKEKDKRAENLTIANKELEFQNIEKDKRADELVLANIEKDRRADDLVLANKEKDKRAENLIIANKELALQNIEKDKRADELVLANIEKDRRTEELHFANIEKDKRADELVLANKEKDDRANELFLANIEKDRRADELVLANKEKDQQENALAIFREKSSFFARMSHEMRTPLNGILSAIQLLDNGKLTSEQQEFLDAARISGNILLGHVNDVLIIERNDNSQMKPCNVSLLTSEISTIMTPLANTSRHVLCLDKRGLDDRRVITDHRAIQQIMMNLISNAIKFSSDGDIILRVFYGQFEDGNMALHIEVSDNGLGLSPKDIERIFDDFVVLDDSYERNANGTGLGLGIVRTLVKRLGGDVRCVSTVGQGSQFIVRLIVTLAEDGNLEAITEESPPLAPVKLLVVDDNEINRVLLKAMLKRLGHEVALAKGGQEAVAVALKSKFDAILMDISMPKLNGLQATHAIINGDGPNRTTPIIAVTAHAMPNEQNEYAKAGMLGFIQKPVKLGLLKTTLFSICSSKKKPSPSKTPKIERDICGEKPFVNKSHLIELIKVLGRDKLSDLVKAMIKQVGEGIPTLINAQAAQDLQDKSHAMAGVSGSLGAERMHSLLNDIETTCKDGDFPSSRGLVELLPATWHQTHLALKKIVFE
jgi:signal transduction histidine kinase/ActR/RegA family two-component response regulator